MAIHEAQSEPSLVGALGRLVEAGQRTLIDRIDLARLEVVAVVTRTMRGAVFLLLGAVIAMVGWLALTAAAILFLSEYFFTLPASAAIVGLINAVIGVGLVVLGAQQARSEPDRSEATR